MATATRAALGLLASAAALVALGACRPSDGSETSFTCKCWESEDTANTQTMDVCASNEHGAIAAARACHGTVSNSSCTCADTGKPCKLGGCR